MKIISRKYYQQRLLGVLAGIMVMQSKMIILRAEEVLMTIQIQKITTKMTRIERILSMLQVEVIVNSKIENNCQF